MLETTVKEFKAMAKDIIQVMHLRNEIVFLPSEIDDAIEAQDFDKVTALSKQVTSLSNKLNNIKKKYAGNDVYAILEKKVNQYSYSKNITPDYLYDRHSDIFDVIDHK